MSNLLNTLALIDGADKIPVDLIGEGFPTVTFRMHDSLLSDMHELKEFYKESGNLEKYKQMLFVIEMLIAHRNSLHNFKK